MLTSAPISILRAQTRSMIGQLVAALLEEGYRQDVAYRIALTQAEEWAVIQRTSKDWKPMRSYHVIPHPNGWTVRQSMSTPSDRFFNAREEAVQFGQKLAQNSKSALVIHDSLGEFEARTAYLKSAQ